MTNRKPPSSSFVPLAERLKLEATASQRNMVNTFVGTSATSVIARLANHHVSAALGPHMSRSAAISALLGPGELKSVALAKNRAVNRHMNLTRPVFADAAALQRVLAPSLMLNLTAGRQLDRVLGASAVAQTQGLISALTKVAGLQTSLARDPALQAVRLMHSQVRLEVKRLGITEAAATVRPLIEQAFTSPAPATPETATPTPATPIQFEKIAERIGWLTAMSALLRGTTPGDRLELTVDLLIGVALAMLLQIVQDWQNGKD